MLGSCYHCASRPSQHMRFGSLCRDCTRRCYSDPLKHAAHCAVTRAINHGELARAKTLTCADCGEQAHDWDHRDYSKPLAVEAVCRSCNQKRGPALNGQNHPKTLARLFPKVWARKSPRTSKEAK